MTVNNIAAEDEVMFKTDDMALAAYIALHLKVLRAQWIGDSCYWFFEDSDDLADLVTDFSGGKARVDPREYNNKFARMKKEMFSIRDTHDGAAVHAPLNGD